MMFLSRQTCRFIRAIFFKQPWRNSNSSEKGFILAAVIGLVVILEILMSGVFIKMLAQFKQSEIRTNTQDALQMAESGIQRAIFELKQNATWRAQANDAAHPIIQQKIFSTPGDTSTLVGSYIVQAHTTSNWGTLSSVYVRSDGKSSRPPIITRTILVRVVAVSSSIFFTSTLGKLRINSGSNIDGDIVASDLSFSDGGNINVTGGAYYSRSVTGDAGPNVIVAGGISQTSAVGFTGLDTNRYAGLGGAGGAYISGDQTFSGTLRRSDYAATNGVIFVDGNVTIDGDYDDDITIVATGDIIINGSLVNHANPGNPGAAGNKQIALMAGGNVKIGAGSPPDIDVEAYILADGGIFEAEGPTGSKGTLNFTGAMSVRGSPDLNDPNVSGVDLKAFANRNYAYNQEFKANVTIPFLPSIANVVEWRQINPNDQCPMPVPCLSGMCLNMICEAVEEAVL